ncbi:MAG: hypothetical protein QP733_02125 [Dialister micraerophilus]|uniref:Uncharacterized protein n=1 Tax=Dialister micraerophilus UPII 345-E TaxID=910314 RepID=E4LA71_9FIRM|nr:hypothetical protein [Dialister micraerophilus]EFR42346.1 hypothetical protein HMPREF9220_0638 [Dialister micraerophilus UPII 345-E]MDK8253238.1 hypothetical protein [Dialister micraerophilus]
MEENAKNDLEKFVEVGLRLEHEKESLINGIKRHMNPLNYLAELTIFLYLSLLQAQNVDKEVANDIIDFNIKILKILKENDGSVYELMDSVSEECFKKLMKD